MKTFAILLSLAIGIGLPLWMLLTLVAILWGWCEEAHGWLRGRSWRYSLRELFVVVTSVAAVLGGLAVLLQWMTTAH
jgi:hypothetical protein